MRKIFIIVMCGLLSSNLFAQIGEITTSKSRYEIKRALKNVCVIHDIEEDSYQLSVGSDNQFEEKNAYFNLGTGAQEALESLCNLNKAIQQNDIEFHIGEYKIKSVKIGNKCQGFIYTTGSLEYAAGAYWFDSEAIGNAAMQFLDQMNDVDYSDVIVSTTEIYGSEKSSVGITGITCEFYIPSLGLTLINGVNRGSFDNAKAATKLMSKLPKQGELWNKNDYMTVYQGISSKILSTPRPKTIMNIITYKATH